MSVPKQVQVCSHCHNSFRGKPGAFQAHVKRCKGKTAPKGPKGVTQRNSRVKLTTNDLARRKRGEVARMESWRAAVATGETSLGFKDWIRHRRDCKKCPQPVVIEVAATLSVEVRGASSKQHAREMLRDFWGHDNQPIGLVDGYGNFDIGVRLAE